MQRIAALAALAAALAGAAGCGGSGQTQPSTLPSPAEFRAQAAKLCSSARSKLASIEQPRSAKDIAAYLRKVKRIASPYVDKLAQLQPPRQFARPFNTVVALNRQELSVVSRVKRILRHGGSRKEAAQIIQDNLGKLTRAENARWRQMGVTQCAG